MSKDEEGKKDKSRKLRQKKLVAKKNKVKKEKALKIKQAANPDDAKLNKEVALEKLKKQSKNMSNNLLIVVLTPCSKPVCKHTVFTCSHAMARLLLTICQIFCTTLI